MSIEKLFRTLGKYKTCHKKFDTLYIEMFMEQVVDILLDQRIEIIDLRKQLAQKDAINVNNIKEVKNLNGR